MSGFGLRPYADQMHALAVEICDFLNGPTLLSWSTEGFELHDLQLTAQVLGDLLSDDDPAGYLQGFLDDARASLEASKQGGAS